MIEENIRFEEKYLLFGYWRDILIENRVIRVCLWIIDNSPVLVSGGVVVD
jgi:hypothetical protein